MAFLGVRPTTAAAAAAAVVTPLFNQPGPLPTLEKIEARSRYRSRPEGELEEVRDWTGLGMVWCGVFRASLDAAAFECAAFVPERQAHLARSSRQVPLSN